MLYVQAYYARRIHLRFGLAFISEIYIGVGISQYLRIQWISLAYFAVGTVCDVVIAVVQMVYLHMHRPDSDNPGIVAIIQLITLVILHLNYTQIVLSSTTGALYAISLLANLDSRRVLREADTDTEGLDVLRTSRIRLDLLNISFKKTSTTNSSNAIGFLPGVTMDVSAVRSTTEDRQATVSERGNIESVV
ncbi:hypothetical protein DXG01_010331 [Tephrocybe rancida]|nr:hypothetical protein DXG01_010331 [Tephrocybe rancida]